MSLKNKPNPENMNPTEMITLKRTARIAGILYLLVAIIGPIGLMYIPSQIIVWGDAATTANNMLEHEFLFRSSIALRIVVQVLMLLVVWFLYRLLKRVNEHRARLMLIFYIVAVPTGFMVNGFNITALAICKGDIMASLTPVQLYDFVELFIRVGSYETQLVQLFWGLWLLPFGLLVYKSGFIPRIFGIYLILNGIAFIVLSFTFVLFPAVKSIVYKIALPFFFGEIAMILWLVIIGVKVKQKDSTV